ncbi:hypothetical protein Emed_005554 [Eimeria media]
MGAREREGHYATYKQRRELPNEEPVLTTDASTAAIENFYLADAEGPRTPSTQVSDASPVNAAHPRKNSSEAEEEGKSAAAAYTLPASRGEAADGDQLAAVEPPECTKNGDKPSGANTHAIAEGANLSEPEGDAAKNFGTESQ